MSDLQNLREAVHRNKRDIQKAEEITRESMERADGLRYEQRGTNPERLVVVIGTAISSQQETFNVLVSLPSLPCHPHNFQSIIANKVACPLRDLSSHK